MANKKLIASKANEDMLNTLHQMVAQDLIRRVASGDADIKDIQAAIKFLKDNDVTADVQFNNKLKELEGEVTPIGELPFIDDQDEEDDLEEEDEAN